MLQAEKASILLSSLGPPVKLDVQTGFFVPRGGATDGRATR